MDSSDLVDPFDAALHELLARDFVRTQDVQRRERLIDLMLTLPPSRESPLEALDECRATYEYIRSLLGSGRVWTQPRFELLCIQGVQLARRR